MFTPLHYSKCNIIASAENVSQASAGVTCEKPGTNSPLSHAQPVQSVTERLAQRRQPASPQRLRNGIRTGRNINRDPVVLHHALGAIEMVSIADQQRSFQLVGLEDHRNSTRRLIGIVGLGFGDEVHIRHAQLGEVIASHLALAESRVFARPAGSYDQRSHAPLEQIIGMVETGAIHGRGPSYVFGRAKHYDRVRGMGLIDPGLPHDLHRGHHEVAAVSQHTQGDQPTVRMRLQTAGPRGDYSWPSNSAICSEGIAPWRSSRQPSSLVRSTMVDGMSRGDWPPSTMRGRQSPNWSRTSCAFVHSEAPCRFADVAVIGDPTARIMANGTSAEGTRRATLPVLAVTLSGSFGSALTIIVSGPGQKRRASK